MSQIPAGMFANCFGTTCDLCTSGPDLALIESYILAGREFASSFSLDENDDLLVQKSGLSV